MVALSLLLKWLYHLFFLIEANDELLANIYIILPSYFLGTNGQVFP